MHVGQSVKGCYKIEVLNEGGEVVKQYPWRKNLILDNGIDGLFVGTWVFANAQAYCHIGTGNTPFVYSSGAVTATVNGSTMDTSDAFFFQNMAGMLVNFNQGEQAKIQQYIQPTQVQLDRVITPQQNLFAVYAVGRKALQSQQKTSNTYYTAGGQAYVGQQDYPLAATRVYRRTYDFQLEQANVNYSELGWSYDGGQNNLFSGTLISGGNVTILAGQKIRIIYDLIVTINPTLQSGLIQFPINVWPTQPATNTLYKMAVLRNTLQEMNQQGGVSSYGYSMEPKNNITIGHTPNYYQTFPLFTDNHNAQVTLTNSKAQIAMQYLAGNLYRDFYWQFQTQELNLSTIRTFLENVSGYWGLIICFEQAQTKTSDQTLTVYFRKQVQRLLTNP